MEFEKISGKWEEFLKDEARLKGNAAWICFPKTKEEAVEAFAFGREHRRKITLQGGRTGLAGGAVPQGGLIVNFSRMTGLGEVMPQADGSALLDAEAGVTLDALIRKAAPYVFPPNPTEKTAELGGLFATGACGPRGLSCGPVSSSVERLTWLTPDGEIWEIHRGDCVGKNGTMVLPNGREIPCPHGLDLIDYLSCGEGTIGAALSFRLRLQRKVRDLWSLCFFLEDQNQAEAFYEAVRDTKNLRLRSGEFYDHGALELLRRNSLHPLLKGLPSVPGRAAVNLCLEGREEETETMLGALLDLFEACGGKEENSWAENGLQAEEKFLSLRHGLTTILGEMPEITDDAGLRWEADFRGPADQFPVFLKGCQTLLAEAGISGAIYGHMLENSLHCALLPETEEEKQAAPGLLRKIGEFAVEHGGSVCSEYGIGSLGLSRYGNLLPREPGSLAEKKRILAPQNLLGF